VVTITRSRSFVLGCSALAVLALCGSGLAVLVLSGSTSRAEDPQPAPHAEPPRPRPRVEAPRPAPIDRNGVLILIRSALLALDEANKTGNYSVLRDLGAPGFQQANSDARLAEIFAPQRKTEFRSFRRRGAGTATEPVAADRSQGHLRMAGFFPSVPTQVNFELLYVSKPAVAAHGHCGLARPNGAWLLPRRLPGSRLPSGPRPKPKRRRR
jgi:hypothetical protein